MVTEELKLALFETRASSYWYVNTVNYTELLWKLCERSVYTVQYKNQVIITFTNCFQNCGFYKKMLVMLLTFKKIKEFVYEPIQLKFHKMSLIQTLLNSRKIWVIRKRNKSRTPNVQIWLNTWQNMKFIRVEWIYIPEKYNTWIGVNDKIREFHQ